jgi:nucleotide-binding universal stress UspA family protein
MAVAEAQSNGAELVLLRAVGIPADSPYTGTAMSPTDVLNVLEQRAEVDLTELARDLIPAGVPWKVLVDTNTAWPAICSTAQAIDAALIVIGAHGYGAIDRMLGTTAARVVNHADRSVLVVRPPEAASAPETTQNAH